MVLKPLFQEIMEVKEPKQGDEIKSLKRFYDRPFKVEEIGELFKLEVEQRPSGQINIIYGDMMLIFTTERRFVVVYYKPEAAHWGRENRQPYPQTISDFIDSCWSLNVELYLTERGKDELGG